MEPITYLTSFASIIGLVGVYKAEKSEAKNFDQYIDWLRRQEHTQLVDLIQGNAELTHSVRDLIEDRHGEVMAKLESLDKVLASVASHIDGFQPLANVIGKSQLSDQAVSVLRQLNKAGASTFRRDHSARNGTVYQMLDKQEQVQVSEPRFIESDLDTLCNFGLLLLSHNDSGGRIFTITRAGAAVGGTAG